MKTKQIFLSIIAFAFILILINACQKQRAEKKSTQPEYTNMDDFYDQNQPEEQVFTIDSTGQDSITGQQGTKIWGIPKTIFMYKSNHQDIVYPYTLKLIEAYKIKDMILCRLPNLSSNKVLQTSGEIKVTAFKDTNELVLKNHCGYHILAPSSNPVTGLSVFYGFTNGTTNDWNNDVLQTDYLFSSDTVTHLTNQSNGYNMKICKLGWISPAKNITYSNLANITFTAEGTNTNLIDVYIIFDNLHSYIKVNSLAATGLPDGEPVTVFAMGREGSGTMYYFKHNYILSNNLNITLDMQSASETNVLSVMDNL